MSNAFWHGFISKDWNTGLQQNGSSNWGTAAPGAPNAVPTAVPTKVAEFPVNAFEFDISFSQNTTIATLLFYPGVPLYTFDLAAANLTVTGAGVLNPIGNIAPIFWLPPVLGPGPFVPALTFSNQSTAGNAIFSGRANVVVNVGPLLFRDTSTAGSSTIIGVETTFEDSSNAGSATINNILRGTTFFTDHSSASFAKISNSGLANLGVTHFLGGSTAGHATIENFTNGATIFNKDDPNLSTTADHATIRNIGGHTHFWDSFAGDATITNLLNINPTFSAGYTEFLRSDAQRATITNDGGLTIVGIGSTAGSATIVNKNNGITQFEDNGSGGQATITTFDASFTKFIDQSTAGNSTLVVESGGRLVFQDASTGGLARISNKAGGLVDISGLTVASMTIGSIEGAGTFRLGDSILITGGDNLSTTVSGKIEDGGAQGGVGGALVKVGSGTLTLAGQNTYTGLTFVVDGKLAFGAGGSIAGGLAFLRPNTVVSALAQFNAQSVAALAAPVTEINLAAASQIAGSISGLVSGVNIHLDFHKFAPGDHLFWTASGEASGTLALIDTFGTTVVTLSLADWHSGSEFVLAGDGDAGTVITTSALISPTTLQNDYFAITRSVLSLDEAKALALSINAGTHSEAHYVEELFAQVASTTIPAVAVEASMYGHTGTSAEVTKLVTEFLPAQIANAIRNGYDPVVYACEALGLAFAFGDENGGTAFATRFGPANADLPNSTAGDAAFAALVARIVFGLDEAPHTASVIETWIANWKALYTQNGVAGIPNATPEQIDLAARGAAWGDAIGVALVHELGPYHGYSIDFLEAAAQGLAIHGAPIEAQANVAGFQSGPVPLVGLATDNAVFLPDVFGELV